MTNLKPLTFMVPLAWEAHSLAEHYRTQQATTAKAKQVYLNTLAVYAVDHYLRCLGFKPDLPRSDSRNSLALNFLDVADLVVPGLGTLECRPVLPNADVLEIPSEAREDRIGYLAVQFNPSLKKAEILGFTSTAVAQIPLSDLRSLSELPDYFEEIRHEAVINQLSPFHPEMMVELGKWFDGVVDAGWQSLDSMLNSPQLVAFRGPSEFRLMADLKSRTVTDTVNRAKLIDLGLQLGDLTVMLVIILATGEDQTVSALVQVHPASDLPYLPPQLQLRLLSEKGKVMQAVWSRGQDNYIQLKRFSGQGGDRFRLQVMLGEITITENFVF